ncbi:MAG TPA: DUF3108 domain-containing protein [Bacteroidota bacterium]|jgi:hypothetical protein
MTEGRRLPAGLLILAGLACFIGAAGPGVPQPVNVEPDPAADTLRRIHNRAFAAGEELHFDVNYLGVTAGEASLTVSDTVYQGKKCYSVVFRLKSKPFFDMFYQVEDRYNSVIDAEGLFPWRFEQHLREGGYRKDFKAEFDQVRHVAKTTEGTRAIPPYVQDMMSALYFSRSVDYSRFKAGEKIHLQNFYKDSTYELDVRFRGRQEIEVEAGKFKCIVIEPMAHEGGLFRSEGRLYVWLTDDERKMPVRVSTKIAIGSVDSELLRYRGINGRIDSKIEDD